MLFSVCSSIRYHYYYQHHKYGTLNRNWFSLPLSPSISSICCFRFGFLSFHSVCCTIFYWSCSWFHSKRSTLWMWFLLCFFGFHRCVVCVLYCSFTWAHNSFFLFISSRYSVTLRIKLGRTALTISNNNHNRKNQFFLFTYFGFELFIIWSQRCKRSFHLVRYAREFLFLPSIRRNYSFWLENNGHFSLSVSDFLSILPGFDSFVHSIQHRNVILLNYQPKQREARSIIINWNESKTLWEWRISNNLTWQCSARQSSFISALLQHKLLVFQLHWFTRFQFI